MGSNASLIALTFGPAGSGRRGGGGLGGNPELQYLQMQIAGGVGSNSITRLAAMPDLESQLQNQSTTDGNGGSLPVPGRHNSGMKFASGLYNLLSKSNFSK